MIDDDTTARAHMDEALDIAIDENGSQHLIDHLDAALIILSGGNSDTSPHPLPKPPSPNETD